MKKIAYLLTITMLVVLILPAAGYAAVDEGLEKALVAARQKYDIPEDAEFDYSMVQPEQGGRVWYLRWTSRDQDVGSLEIGMLDDGSVISYYRYMPYSFQGRRLPKVDEEEARLTADEFIKEAYPEIFPDIRYYRNDSVRALENYYYNFSYVRVVNGIPFYNDVVNVSVNHQTGEVTSYNVQWTYMEFPMPEGILTQDQAREAYVRNIGMEPVYRHKTDDGKVSVFAVYTPALDSSLYAIDAFNGEAVKLRQRYGILRDEAAFSIEKENLMKAAGEIGEITLSPEELEALGQGADLLDESEAVSAALSAQVLELDDSYQLSHSSLAKNYSNKDEILWRLRFEKNIDDITTRKRTNVVIDALTGEVKSFSKSYYTEPGEKATYGREEARKEVEKFLSWFASDRYVQTQYFEKYNDHVQEGDELPTSQSFNFTRIVDGTPYPDNGITVAYDAVTGKISRYSLNWYDADFPDLENAVQVGNIYENLFSVTGLELQYKTDYTVSDEQKICLVYALFPEKPVDFDAFTGKPVYSDGTPWKEEQPFEYTDIKGSYAADEIAVLARYGIGFQGGLFNPRSRITQLQFLMLFSKAIDGYYGSVITPDSTQEEIDELYAFLARRGIVTKGEKNPDGSMSKEECVKYVVRALGYGKAAEIPGIYKTRYTDEASISKGLLGHVAIASGLGIVQGSGGRFNPAEILTREQAAVIIYNYLTF